MGYIRVHLMFRVEERKERTAGFLFDLEHLGIAEFMYSISVIYRWIRCTANCYCRLDSIQHGH